MFNRIMAVVVAGALLISPASAQLVVSDPVQQTLQGINNQVQQAHTTFMKLQMVQDAEILKNNFLQAQSYYNYIDERSKHRGGLVGFYKEMVQNDLNSIVDQQKMDLAYDANNVTGPTLVNDFAAQASAAASKAAVDAVNNAGNSFDGGVNGAGSLYGDSKLGSYNSALRQRRGTRAASFSRNVTIASAAGAQIDASNTKTASLSQALSDLQKQAMDPNIDDKTYESLQLSIQGVQAQLGLEQTKLASITAQLTKAMLDSSNIEQAFSRQTAADFQSYVQGSAAARATAGSDANAVKTELKRMPR